MTPSDHTPLQALSLNLQDMIDAVGSADSDIKSLQQLLGDLKKTLGYPAKMEGDLNKIQGPLTTVQKLANDISFLPEIGPPAGAMAKAIHPFVLPSPPGGLIGEARSFLSQIDKALAPLKAGLDKIKGPVDKVQGQFDAVLDKLHAFKAGVDDLIRSHGHGRQVNNCAQALNNIIDTVKQDLSKAMGAIESHLSAFFKVGSAIDGALQGIGSFFSAIDSVVQEITTSAAFRQMNTALHKIDARLDELRHKWDVIVKGILHSMGLDLNAFENGMVRFEHRIEHFVMKSVNDTLHRAESAIASELEHIPGVDQFVSGLETLRDEVDTLRKKVETGLGAECTKVLTSGG